MSWGNVVKAVGTGLRQLAGIFSVVDVSGSNIAFFSSNSIILGNSLDQPEFDVISPLVKIIGTGNNPAFVLNQPGAPADQKNTVMRLSATGNGAVTIATATDSNPSQSVESWLSMTRAGSAIAGSTIGQTGSTFPTLFASTGSTTFAGTVVPQNGIVTQSGTIANWPSGSQAGIFTAPAASFALYLVSATLPGVNDPANYNSVALFSVNANSGRLTTLQSGALMTFSIAGLTVLATQGSGANQTIFYAYTRLV